MRIYLAADHAGFALKLSLKTYLASASHEVVDLGAASLVPGDDYPDVIAPLAKRVAGEPGAFGIALGGSGQGEAMAANRVKGARAAVFYGAAHAIAPLDEERNVPGDGYDIVRLARAHNDANILSIGARFVSIEEVREAVRLFLETPFSGGERHRRRLAKF